MSISALWACDPVGVGVIPAFWNFGSVSHVDAMTRVMERSSLSVPAITDGVLTAYWLGVGSSNVTFALDLGSLQRVDALQLSWQHAPRKVAVAASIDLAA